MYYIDSTSFSTATAVYTDELLTIKAPDGYYKFETGYREQLGGLLLNSIECTTCIDCKQLASVSVKTGSPFTVTYTDCWGYPHTMDFIGNPSYVQGHVRTIDLTETNICVKNGSAYGSGIGFFHAEYINSEACNTSTGLIQSLLCGPGSATPTGCDIDCDALEASSSVYIQYHPSIYLENDMYVYKSNNVLEFFLGGDLYYKVIYNNIVYGVRINDAGKIYELTYCNP